MQYRAVLKQTLLWLVLLAMCHNSLAEAPANPFTILLEHAQQGNADAMFEVAKYYENGEYTPQSWPESIRWYEASVARNHYRAMLHLGRLLLQGVPDALEPDTGRGLQLIEDAANAGEAEAQFQLGQMFEQGEVVEQDLPSAIRWYRAASLQKYPGARRALKRSISAFKKRAHP